MRKYFGKLSQSPQNEVAREENKFNFRKKIYIQLNVFIKTNKIVHITVDDREKEASVLEYRPEKICWPNSL